MNAKVTIQEAEHLLQEIMSEEDDRFQILMKDERKGVQKLISKWYKQKELAQKEKEKFLEMSKYENALREKGLTYIAGIDEVGRGPLAGPVVTAAVVLPKDFYIPGLNDSKKLSEAKRERFMMKLKRKQLQWSWNCITASY